MPSNDELTPEEIAAAVERARTVVCGARLDTAGMVVLSRALLHLHRENADLHKQRDELVEMYTGLLARRDAEITELRRAMGVRCECGVSCLPSWRCPACDDLVHVCSPQDADRLLSGEADRD